MKCPACKSGNLVSGYLEDLFLARTCDHCGGNWLLLEDYLHWLQRTPPQPLAASIEYEIMDSKHVLLCPVTGTMMLKYRISGATDHRLDLSSDISGIWMDKGEWELLKSEGLAHQLNSIFTEPWQRRIQSERTAEILSARYEDKFGAENYQKVKEFREWLLQQGNHLELLAYLIAKDPYSVKR